MLCYLDRAFCGSPNCKNACGRKLTPKHATGAAKWAKTLGVKHAPICYSNFCDENGELIRHEATS